MKLKGIILQKNKIWDAFVAMLKTVLNVLRANKGEENSLEVQGSKITPTNSDSLAEFIWSRNSIELWEPL